MTPRYGIVLCERFANPVVFAIFSADEDDETVSGSIVGMEEIGDNFEEAESAGKDEENVFRAEEIVEILLELLESALERAWE